MCRFADWVEPMRLLIDIGNQRTKWMTSDQLAASQVKGVRHPALSGLDNTSDRFARELNAHFALLDRPQSVWIASVAEPMVQHKVMTCIQQRWGLSANPVRSSYKAGGVINHYRCPGSLGADRWAAIIAARHLPMTANRHVVVVDAGTAITIDVVHQSGDFMGGVILPGIETMKKTLNTRTGKITITTSWDDHRETLEMMNTDTETAVTNGVLLAAVSAVESAIERCKRWFDGSPVTVLTGGDGRAIRQLTCQEMVWDEYLVMKGIDLIASEERGAV